MSRVTAGRLVDIARGSPQLSIGTVVARTAQLRRAEGWLVTRVHPARNDGLPTVYGVRIPRFSTPALAAEAAAAPPLDTVIPGPLKHDWLALENPAMGLQAAPGVVLAAAPGAVVRTPVGIKLRPDLMGAALHTLPLRQLVNRAARRVRSTRRAVRLAAAKANDAAAAGAAEGGAADGSSAASAKAPLA